MANAIFSRCWAMRRGAASVHAADAIIRVAARRDSLFGISFLPFMKRTYDVLIFMSAPTFYDSTRGRSSHRDDARRNQIRRGSVNFQTDGLADFLVFGGLVVDGSGTRLAPRHRVGARSR